MSEKADEEILKETALMLHITCRYPVRPEAIQELIEAQYPSVKDALEEAIFRIKGKISQDLAENLCAKPSDVGMTCALLAAVPMETMRKRQSPLIPGGDLDALDVACDDAMLSNLKAKARSGSGERSGLQSIFRQIAGDDNYAEKPLDKQVLPTKNLEEAYEPVRNPIDTLTLLQKVANNLLASYKDHAARTRGEDVAITYDLVERFENLMSVTLFLGVHILKLDEGKHFKAALECVNGEEGVANALRESFGVNLADFGLSREEFLEMSDSDLDEIAGHVVEENKRTQREALSGFMREVGVRPGSSSWIAKFEEE